MDKSKVKELLIKAKNSDTKNERPHSCRKAYVSLKRRATKSGEGVLFDNFYLVEEAYSALRAVRVSRQLRYYASVLLPVMSTESIYDDLSAFFEVLADTLDSDECERVRQALFAECIVSLADNKLDSPELIRALQSFDFTPFLLGFARYEKLLRSDSVYCALDRETKLLYKEKIKKYSKARGLTFTEGCERLINEASHKGCHIGELLPFQKGAEAWLILPAVIFILLCALLLSVLNRSLSLPVTLLVFALAVIPIWQTAFELFVPIVARFRKCDILPRLDMPKIPEKYAVLTAVASLGTSVEETRRMFSHLETLSLKTRSRGKDEFAFWGILLDLPESKTPVCEGDERILDCAKKEINRLNKLYSNRFVLFTRDREWNSADGVFTAYERKRGAIIELVRYLSTGESSLKCYGASLPHIKYVLTLDSDTDMELGALNRMVGTMAHPLNTPTIEQREGVSVVTGGFGILQPALASALETGHKTRFSTLMSGSGGINTYHSSIFNLNSAIFGRGIFCGKGMFDVSVFAKVINSAFPDGIILSHDILEGTRLRTGYLPDICFFDSIPSGVISYYNRAHRWARGDIQALSFVGKNIKTPDGIKKNPMRASERFVFLMNFISLTVPIFQVLGLFALMRYGIEAVTSVSFFFLLPSLTPFFNEVLRASFYGSLSNVLRRFFGDTLTALCRESILLGYRLSSLSFLAYKNADAILRALWRINISKKKLLEWTTASQGESVKKGLVKSFAYTLPSFVAGVFMLAFSRLSLCRLLGILWCSFFWISHRLDQKSSPRVLSAHKKRILTGYARDIWRYFERYADETNNFLPPDNVSVFPSSEVACRTSPTNIGLYFLSVLSALDFSFISLDDAVLRLDRSLTAVEKLPKYRGQLYNWYSTLTLEVIGQEYISTVDSGNFVTSLVALYEGLGEYESRDRRIKGIRERIKAIENASDFRFLFNPSRNLFSLGFFTESEKQDSILYDMYMSEARTTDYYAVARGLVRDSHWSQLSRPLITTLGGIGALSWSGTAFEYFMPHLLLPLYKNSFADEALSFAFSQQVKFECSWRRETVFGISESGYFAFDESLGYQYRAFGVPSLSRRIESESQRVISPYSSFLMLRSGAGLVMKNLEALERMGMYGEFGFYEALDFAPSRVGNTPSVVKSFMSHHLGMSLVACANAVFDDIFVSRFMSDAEMRAVNELLKEAVPADAISLKKEKLKKPVQRQKRIVTVKEDSPLRTEAGMWALTGRELSGVFFERGAVSLDLSLKRGECISVLRPIDKTKDFSLFMFSLVGDNLSSPSLSPDVSYFFDTGYAEYRQGELRTTVSLSAVNTALRIRLEAIGEKGEVGIYFEPILAELEAFMSHPAFSNIFFKAEYSDSALLLTRQGEKPCSMAIVSNAPFSFEVSKETLFEGRECNITNLADICRKSLSSSVSDTPISPCVFLKSSFSQRTDTTFVVGLGRTKSEALANATEELATPFARSIKRSRELFYSALAASGQHEGFDRGVFEALLYSLRPETELVFKNAFPKPFGKGAVYSLGLSGRYPVLCVKNGLERDELMRVISCHKLHYIMGLRYELFIQVNDSGYSRGGKGELEGIIDELQCRFLVGRSGGIHFADMSTLSSEMLASLSSAHYPPRHHTKRFKVKNSIVQAEPCQTAQGDILIREKPPVLWSHIIASSTFGTIVNHRSLGNTWVYNSRLSRITYWENDSVGGRFSEKIYMEKDGVQKDLCASASAVNFSGGMAEYIGRHFNIKVTIHPTLMFKAVSVSVENDNFSLIYRFLPVLDDFPRPSGRVEFFADSKNSVVFANLFSDSFSKGFGYLFLPFEKEMKLGDDFGVWCQRGGEVVFVLGYAGSQRHYEAVKAYFENQRFSDVLALSQNAVNRLLKNEKNYWLAYQTLVSRFWARSGPYQSGGAWGFRDQAQDCLTLVDFSPETVRAHIMRMASHQYKEGDVQHWWHGRRGVRTHCSDDYLWLVWLTCMYIKKTKDKSVLGLKASYLISKPLNSFEKDRYEIPDRSDEGYTLLHHMKSALDLMTARGLGTHSLPLMLGGDWNDGMNMLPNGSESVWLGFFDRLVIHFYTELTGDRSYVEFSQRIKKGLEENAFFSDRYARAFLPDGRVMGVDGSEFFEIDALPQAFSSICHSITGDGNVSRITLALDSAWEHLYDAQKGIFRLFTPSFDSFDKTVGYVSAYPAGLRENGGQYTHAAVWAALGYLYAPDKKDINHKRGTLLAKIIDPASHQTDIYKNESYVLSGDVYTSGRGGWSWYTGSASWYRDLLLRILDEKRNNETPFS